MADLLVNSATLLEQRTKINSAFIEINSLTAGLDTGFKATQFVTSSATVVARTRYMLNSSAGAFGLTMPSSPADGQEAYFKDDASALTSTNKVGLHPAGSQKIMGLAEAMDLTYADAWLILRYKLADLDWRITEGS